MATDMQTAERSVVCLVLVPMTKIGKFQQSRWICVAKLFKWLKKIALNGGTRIVENKQRGIT